MLPQDNAAIEAMAVGASATVAAAATIHAIDEESKQELSEQQ